MSRSTRFAFLLLAAWVAVFVVWARFKPKTPGLPGVPLVMEEEPLKHVVTPEMSEESRTRIGQAAPRFAKSDVDGKTFRLEEMIARGPVVLTFIKAGCPCSEAAQPFFEKLHAAYPGAQFLGVIDVNTTQARRWGERFGVRYPMLIDVELDMMRAYGIDNSAYVVVIRPDGTIAAHWPGYSMSMLKSLGGLLAGLTATTEVALDVQEAPDELYSGCPFDL